MYELEFAVKNSLKIAKMLIEHSFYTYFIHS